MGRSIAAIKLVIRSLAARTFSKEKRQLMTLSSSAAAIVGEICAIFADPIAHPRPMTPARRSFSDAGLPCV